MPRTTISHSFGVFLLLLSAAGCAPSPAPLEAYSQSDGPSPSDVLGLLEAIEAGNFDKTVRDAATNAKFALFGVAPELIEPAAGPLVVQGTVTNAAKVRARPSIEGRRLGGLQAGNRVRVINRVGSWYEILFTDELGEQRIGYVFYELVDIAQEHVEMFEAEGESQNFLSRTTEPAAIPPDLNDAVDELADAVEKEGGAFRTGAFECREDRELCSSRYSFLDCELLMVTCLASMLLGGN